MFPPFSVLLLAMARPPTTTQWDFGELFPIQPARKILSVAELTSQIRRLIETGIGVVWVSGELTNLRCQNSGHIYFTLKDAAAQLNCVLFRGELQVDRSLLQDGRKITVQGQLTVYEPRGQYQLRVTSVELEGIGALQVAFERLKQKLKAEGLFAPERKRPLPEYPHRIGLVTSPTGAAIRDVLHVVQRRNPTLEIVLAPCRVQGDGASREIAAAIALLNDYHLRCTAAAAPAPPGRGLDLILLTRGGGSLEDLWAFNEELVARAIFHSALPVVSAIGHEIDFTISDFVADLRAATPSAAAELITERVFASCRFVAEARVRLQQLAREQWREKQLSLTRTQQRLARLHPRRRLDDWSLRLDDLQIRQMRCLKQGARRHRLAWQNLSERLGRLRPGQLLKQRREVFEQARQRFTDQAQHRLSEARHNLETLTTRLRLLGPEQVLARGYSITMNAETGEILREAELLQAGQRLRTRLKHGAVHSRVEP
jgi:exodeoxyribonuclease VII large subunit